MQVELINKPKKGKNKKGEEVTYDCFYVLAPNGSLISIEAGEGHSATDKDLNTRIWVQNVTALRLLATKVDE